MSEKCNRELGDFYFSVLLKWQTWDDLDVDTKYVNGSIGNAKWGVRAYVGYEF